MAYINAEKVINELLEKQTDDIREQIGIYEAIDMLYRVLAAETADVVEVKHGKWKVYSDKYPRYVCTNCNHLWNNKEFRYCPTCGAKMDGGESCSTN